MSKTVLTRTADRQIVERLVAELMAIVLDITQQKPGKVIRCCTHVWIKDIDATLRTAGWFHLSPYVVPDTEPEAWDIRDHATSALLLRFRRDVGSTNFVVMK